MGKSGMGRRWKQKIFTAQLPDSGQALKFFRAYNFKKFLFKFNVHMDGVPKGIGFTCFFIGLHISSLFLCEIKML